MRAGKKTAHGDSNSETRKHVGDIGERKVMLVKDTRGQVDFADIFARLIVGETEEEVVDYCYRNGFMTEEDNPRSAEILYKEISHD